MIPCDFFLLLRTAGGDLGFLTIDPAETDIAIGPGRTNRERIATKLRRYCHLRLLRARDGQPRRHYAAKKRDKRTPLRWAATLLPTTKQQHMLTAPKNGSKQAAYGPCQRPPSS
jgi:hypothetical protein